MKLSANKKIYFLSDFHLGVPTYSDSRQREHKLIRFLNFCATDAEYIFIIGDIFDFWFEYNTVVPKGFVRILAKIAELQERGINIFFFTGNHDLWMRDYFELELGVKIFHEPQPFNFNDKKFLIGHGDGLGPGNSIYKIQKKIFLNPVCKFLFKWLHPDLGIKLALKLSHKSKTNHNHSVSSIKTNESIISYCKEQALHFQYDYFVFGHSHYPNECIINNNSVYYNVGDWITQYSFGVFDGVELKIEKFNFN
ncbi:MAG: UDP-2,3-diacylglucosamine diphosphatase [Sediminibacterium sp.]|nr:UDP-2,3-diacylglucosamine diphosphatase [Sediminibacterium sp.]